MIIISDADQLNEDENEIRETSGLFQHRTEPVQDKTDSTVQAAAGTSTTKTTMMVLVNDDDDADADDDDDCGDCGLI